MKPEIQKAIDELKPDTFFHKHSQFWVTHTVDRSKTKRMGLGKTPNESREKWYQVNFANNA